jgi:hypothetical protein
MRLSTLQHWEAVLEEASALPPHKPPSPQNKAAYTLAPSSTECGCSGAAASATSHISNAWKEAAEAAEAERTRLDDELAELKAELAQTTSSLERTQNKLESSELSNLAYSEAAAEASDAMRSELNAALTQAEARAEAKTRVLSSTAEMALRDVANLRAQKVLTDVHGLVLGRELALLDGTVGFLVARLRAMHVEHDALLLTQQKQAQKADEAQVRADAARLEMEHLRNVSAAQRRTIDELKGVVDGAQGWAHDAEARFEETLVAIRYAASEQLTVQERRMSAWEEELHRLQQQQLRQQHATSWDGPPRRERSPTATRSPPRGEARSGAATKQPGSDGSISDLIAAERELIAAQASLFAAVRGGPSEAGGGSKLLVQRLADAEVELSRLRSAERDLAAELRATSQLHAEQHVAAAQNELGAARSRLREQERTIARMHDWMGSEVAHHRAAFEAATQELLDQASRMTAEEAGALAEAAAAARADRQHGQQAAGTSDTAEADRRRRDRDAQLLKSVELPGGEAVTDAASWSGGGTGAGTSARGAEGAAGHAGMVPEAELLAVKRKLAGAEEELRYRLEEAASAAQRTQDAHRREMANSARWASRLEAQLEQTTAALALEREDTSKLEEELARLRPQLAEAKEHAAQGLWAGEHVRATASSTCAQPAAAAANDAVVAMASPSRRIARARAVLATPMMVAAAEPSADAAHASGRPAPTGCSAAPPLAVGSPLRPQDVALRPSPVLAPRTTSATSAEHGQRAARRPRGAGKGQPKSKAAMKVV